MNNTFKKLKYAIANRIYYLLTGECPAAATRSAINAESRETYYVGKFSDLSVKLLDTVAQSIEVFERLEKQQESIRASAMEHVLESNTPDTRVVEDGDYGDNGLTASQIVSNDLNDSIQELERILGLTANPVDRE